MDKLYDVIHLEHPKGIVHFNKKHPELIQINHVQTNEAWTNEHLYILADDEVKEGDWVITPDFIHDPKTFPYASKPMQIEWVGIHDNVGGGRKIMFPINSNRVGSIKIGERPNAVDFFAFEDTPILKIIATTDTSLNLPKIPDNFLKKYSESKTLITKVKLECEVDWHNNKCLVEEKLPDASFPRQAAMCRANMTNHLNCRGCKMAKGTLIPKLTTNNEVIIRSTQESWNIDEIKSLLDQFSKDFMKFRRDSHYLSNKKEINTFINTWISENL